MGPRPYSERSSLPDSPGGNSISEEQVPIQIIAESPSPPTLSPVGVVSPEPDEVIALDNIIDCIPIIQEDGAPGLDSSATVPFYPSQEDAMPYDHALPDFIRQLTNQPNLANLHSLSLRVISRLISLQRMSMFTPNLRELDLEGSMLGSLRDIGCNLKFLQVLKVGRCQLDSLDGTFGLTSLREFYVQKNLITDVSPCSNLPHIRHIDISYNRIRNISYAGFLSMCNKLRSIVFTGNPATEVAGYREHVRRIIPQLESLDNISFRNDDNCDELEADYIENYAEISDPSSVDNVAPISSSESMNYMIESEEECASMEKSNKQARNVANQEQFDAADYEVQQLFSGKTNKNRLLEQAKMIENRNMNLKQKCASIQKLDKDIENRSKKCNLSLQANFDEENLSLLDLQRGREPLSKQSVKATTDLIPISSSLSSPPGGKASSPFSNVDYPSSSLLLSKYNGKEESIEEIEAFTQETSEREKDAFPEKPRRPSTASNTGRPQSGTVKAGAIKKRPSTATPKIEILPVDEEDKLVSDCGASKLTSGLPVCGNLTAALRNRKKHQTAWEDCNVPRTKSTELILVPKEKNPLKVTLDVSGDAFDNGDAGDASKTDEELVAEDVLASSKRWREAFRRFRSNNRARWEEEDKMDYSDIIPGENIGEKSPPPFEELDLKNEEYIPSD